MIPPLIVKLWHIKCGWAVAERS